MSDSQASNNGVPNSSGPNGPDWLQIAQEAALASVNYMDTNYRQDWENAIRAFQNKHATDSKYNKAQFKFRSKLFRPKTRTLVRKIEAAAAAAYFSNEDLISISPEDDDNPTQCASADVNQALLQYRLSKSIPWFETLMGGVQSASVLGAVVSFQDWDYRERVDKQKFKLIDSETQEHVLDEQGEPSYETVERTHVLSDKPRVRLLPVENVLIDPAADWTDPINTSPYCIVKWPIYAGDVKQMMLDDDPKTGQPKFKNLTDGQLRVAINTQDDTTRAERDNYREDPLQNAKPVQDYEIIWCHENFVRRDGKEYVYWTLGTFEMLSEVNELEEVYFTGERPLVMGVSVLEAHRLYPNSPVTLGKSLQAETNNLANSRMDNIQLVLNKRFLAKRGKNVDLNSLLRNAAGTVTLVDAVDDVQEINFQDITASAYQEQDRINVDYDELVGNFSSSSVQTNGASNVSNQTLGGMGMLAGSANQMTQYLLMTINTTWVEKVLRQLIKLEQKYETNEVIMALAANKAKLYQKYNIDKVTDSLLNQELTCTINMGMAATDPNLRLQKFLMATNAYINLLRIAPPNADITEIMKEIYAHAGYKDGTRFFNTEVDPQVQQLQQQIQGMTQQMQAMQQELKTRSQIKQADNQTKIITSHMDNQTELLKVQTENQTARLKTDADLRKTVIQTAADLHVAHNQNALDAWRHAQDKSLPADAKVDRAARNNGLPNDLLPGVLGH